MVSEINADNSGQVALDYEAILAEYRHRQMLEHLTGPIISLVLHVVLIVAAVFLMVGKPSENSSEVEVTIEELEIKELEPKVMEELQKLEQMAEEVVPTVEKPDVPQEVAEVAVTEDFSDEMAQTDDAMDFSDVLDIKASDTPLKLSGLYGGRVNKGQRKKQLRRFGGSTVTEASVLKALRWLKEHQKPNGSWSRTQPDAMAGLGLLAFLAHGETPASKEFGPTVQKAIQYLTNRMMAVPESRTAGLSRAYVNGIATYALSEAYGLTKIPFVKPAMERGLGFIVRGQQSNGGFDYNYKKTKRWDLSVAGWQIQAMKAGYVAGADVPGLMKGIEKGISFLKKVTFKNGKFGYSSPGSGSWGMQGAGTLCLQLVGEGRSAEAKAGVKNIRENDAVVWKNDGKYVAHTNPAYNWYYETQAMFHAGQSAWRKWNKQFSKVLVAHQKSDGHWECPGKKVFVVNAKKSGHPEYDSVYTTCLCCLSLQVYYRYLPSYKMPKSVASKSKSVLDAIDDDLGLEIE